MRLALNADGLLPGTFSLLWHYLRVETGMKHWVVPLELAEIKNKMATPPPSPSGLLGHQEVGSPGLMPSTDYLYVVPTLFTTRLLRKFNYVKLHFQYRPETRWNDIFLGFSQSR
jgi:hypothetical protein